MRTFLLIAMLTMFTGCAAHTMRPAPVNHPVFITLNDPADVDAIIADCDRLLPAIPGVVSYYCGVPLDTGRDSVDANYNVGVYVGFESIEAYENYVTHPNHVLLVEMWKPRIKSMLVRDVIDETK